MPWNQTDAMNERVGLINDYRSGYYRISELAQDYGVSRKTVYKWIDRFETGGWSALKELSRVPRHSPQAISSEMEGRILEWKQKYPRWGAPKIHSRLRDLSDAPCEATVGNVLRRHGLTRKPKVRRRATPSESPLAHCEQANQVWCADLKGWFRTGDGRRCDPLTISDAHSRYLLRCQGLSMGSQGGLVKPVFIATFRQYGMPVNLRTDNGPPFASTGLGGLSELAVWWVRLGIGLERIEPGQPQQNGRHERLHRTLKEEVITPPRVSLGAQQRAFERFVYEYNHQRPHEALGQQPPSTCYEPSVREYPERLPSPKGYPDEWRTRRVCVGGQIRLRGVKVQVGKALRGQLVGLRPLGEAQWAVHFEDLELGIYDERKGRIIAHKRLKYAPLEVYL